MSLTHVPDDRLAAVVTSLEMADRPLPRPLPQSPLSLVPWPELSLHKYRALFRRVGAPWLWFSRLVITDEALSAIVRDTRVEFYAAVDRTGVEVGMVELDFRAEGQCEIAYFGLIPELAGKGHGRWLMAKTLACAWRKGIDRVWVHTCTLDHPSALNFYRSQGFTPFRRQIETFDDPRAFGVLPADAAPQVPMLSRR